MASHRASAPARFRTSGISRAALTRTTLIATTTAVAGAIAVSGSSSASATAAPALLATSATAPAAAPAAFALAPKPLSAKQKAEIHRMSMLHAEQARKAKKAAARAKALKAAVPASMVHPLAVLRQCESTDNYGANTGNGFYGAYQFDLKTWRSLGLTGLPHQASALVQDAAVVRLHARRGWQPWPVCGQLL